MTCSRRTVGNCWTNPFTVYPASRWSNRDWTATRLPAKQGMPCMTFGLTVTIGFTTVVYQTPRGPVHSSGWLSARCWRRLIRRYHITKDHRVPERVVESFMRVRQVRINPFFGHVRPVRFSKWTTHHSHCVTGHIQACWPERAPAGEFVQIPVNKSEIKTYGMSYQHRLCRKASKPMRSNLSSHHS